MTPDTHLPITPIAMEWEGTTDSVYGWMCCKSPEQQLLIEWLPSFTMAHRIHNALQHAYELGRRQGRSEIKQAVEIL